MRTYAFLPLLLIVILSSSCSKSSDSINSYIGFDIPIDTIDTYLSQKMDELDIPGLAIAFIEDGQIVNHKTMGYASVEDQTRVNDKTIFEAASLSKSVFAFFVMTYVDEGKLDLDRPLYEYMPYPDIAHDERYKTITARMVLSHRSGFPNWRTDFPEKTLFISFEPGTEFLYSGEGYQYLAKVLKKIDNTDWAGLEKNFQEVVCQPLNMEHTVFIQDDYSRLHKAEPYDENGNWISPERDFDQDVREQFIAPASIHTEPLDFSKWMIGLMNNAILSPESYDEMFKAHSFVDKYNGIGVDYTLGFYNPKIPFTNLYSHGGNNYGFTAFFTMDPKKKWGFVLFTNSEFGEQLGGDLTLYMLTGPDHTKLYIIVGIIFLCILLGVVLGLRKLIHFVKKKRS